MSKSKYLFLIVVSLLALSSCEKYQGKKSDEEEKVIELAVPEGLHLESFGDVSVKMAWEPVEKAEFYYYKIIAKVVRNEVAEDSVIALGTTRNTYKSIYDLDPECEHHGFNYWFSVAAGAGTRSCSEYSGYVRCEPNGMTPLVPGNIRVSETTEYGFTFEWDPAESADYYHYQLRNPKGEIVREGDVDGTTKVFDGLKKGRYYYLSVSGANALKSSVFSKPVEALTFGQYIPALTFNASFASEYFSFSEGQDLYVTDGTKWAGYVVKTTGKTTVLELTTEEEVDFGKQYYAYMPAQIHEHGLYDANFTLQPDGTFTGVPAWAKTATEGGTDLVFNSYLGVADIELTSGRSTTISSLRVCSEKPMSGYVLQADENGIDFSRTSSLSKTVADGGITVNFPTPVSVSSTARTIRVPVLAGTYEGVSVVFKDADDAILAGMLMKDKTFEADRLVSDSRDLKLVETVSQVSATGEDLSLYANATISTGTTDDFDFGFAVLPYGKDDWLEAEYLDGTITSSSGKTVLFKAPLVGRACQYVKACVKPKGANVSIASTGPVAFPVLLDFRTGGSTVTACPKNMLPSLAVDAESKYGEEFPVERTAIKNGEARPLTTYLFNGFPLAFATSKMSSDRKYSIYWNKTDGTLDSYKVRFIVYGSTLPGLKASYVYFNTTTAVIYYISTDGKSTKAALTTPKVLAYESDITTLAADTPKVYVCTDANAIKTKYILLLYK